MPGLELAHRRLGAGPPLLFLHGLLGAGRNWQSIAAAVTGYESVLVDLRNHAASPWDEDAGYPALAGDVTALLDRLGIERARIVGHSMGGKVAMTLALTKPARVEHLIVVDIAPVAYPPNLEAYLKGMRALDLARVTRRAEVDAALRQVAPEPAVRGFLLQNLEQAGGTFRWRVNLDALLASMDDVRSFPDFRGAAPFQGPVDVIRGERSDYVTEEGFAVMQPLFPRASLHTVAGAGHWVHSEQQAAFLALLQGCLNETAS